MDCQVTVKHIPFGGGSYINKKEKNFGMITFHHYYINVVGFTGYHGDSRFKV